MAATTTVSEANVKPDLVVDVAGAADHAVTQLAADRVAKVVRQALGRASPLDVAQMATLADAHAALSLLLTYVDPMPTQDAAAIVTAQQHGIALRNMIVARLSPLLTRAQVAAQLGISADGVSKQHKVGKLFALPIGQELRYPALQFDASGRPLAGLRDLLSATGDASAWQVGEFLTLPVDDNGLGDATPLMILRSDDEDAITRLMEVARAVFNPALG